MIANPKPPPPISDRKHLAFIRSLYCCITGTPYGVVCHHLLRDTGEKCGDRKSGDNWVLPICGNMHHELHADGNETRFLESYGIDGPALARALYEATGDYERACAILRGIQEKAS